MIARTMARPVLLSMELDSPPKTASTFHQVKAVRRDGIVPLHGRRASVADAPVASGLRTGLVSAPAHFGAVGASV